MGRGRRNRARNAQQRRVRATASRQQLESILASPSTNSPELLKSAARDIISLSRRHRLGLPKGRRSWICRDCQNALRPSVTCRVRVRGKVTIITCLKCGRINRCGPDHSKTTNPDSEHTPSTRDV